MDARLPCRTRLISGSAPQWRILIELGLRRFRYSQLRFRSREWLMHRILTNCHNFRHVLHARFQSEVSERRANFSVGFEDRKGATRANAFSDSRDCRNRCCPQVEKIIRRLRLEGSIEAPASDSCLIRFRDSDPGASRSRGFGRSSSQKLR